MPDLLTWPSRDLPLDIRCQVNSFMRIHAWQVFRAKPIGRDFIDDATHPISFALVDHHTLISHALVSWRFLTQAGQPYKAYGLSAVLTYPEFRGRGYGHHVVEAASRYILTSDADVALLRCKPELYRFYQASGWIYGVTSTAGRPRSGRAAVHGTATHTAL